MTKAEWFANIQYYFKRPAVEVNNAHRQKKQKELSSESLPSLGLVWLGIGLFFMIFLFGMLKWAKLPTISHVPQQSQFNLSAPILAIPSAIDSSARAPIKTDYEKIEAPEAASIPKVLAIKEQSMSPNSSIAKNRPAKEVDINSRWQISVRHAEQFQTILSQASEEKSPELLQDISLNESASHEGCEEITACGAQTANDVAIEKTAD